MNKTIRILGVDPGSLHTGWGIIDLSRDRRLKCRGFGVIDLPSQKLLHERLLLLWQELTKIIERFGPHQAAVESVFHAHNVQSALKLGHARGVILLCVGAAGCKLTEVAPTEVKQAAVGYGRATKEQVQTMVTNLLGLSEIPKTDAADALAVALALSGHL